MTETAQLQPGDALVIVDAQVDFCPGGALPIPEGDRVIPVLNRWIDAAVRAGIPVYASRDWHPVDHVSFRERGGPWPPHCVQDTPGAAFHPDLRLPDTAIRVSKGTGFDRDQYSALEDTGLGNHWRRRGIRRLWVGGLAQDVCVHHTVLDALREGFEVRLVRGATRPVDAAAGDRCLQELAGAGAMLVEDA